MKLADARKAALAGNIGEALPSLEQHAAAGAASAWAILAQIRAYRSEWDGVLDAVAHLLVDPNDIHASNVTDDAKWLLLRAGHETQRWSDVAAAIKGQATLSRDSNDVFGKMVAKQARAKGELPAPPYAAVDCDRRKQATRERDFEEAMAEHELRWRKKGPKQASASKCNGATRRRISWTSTRWRPGQQQSPSSYGMQP